MARTAGQDIGMALEAAVLAGCKLYLQRRIARIDKVATPISQLCRVGVDGTFKARHASKAHTDFLGVWLDGTGRDRRAVFALECKATTELRLPLSRIEQQQRDWLRDCDGFVLVHFVTLGKVRLVPFYTVDAQRGSIGPDDGWPAVAVEFLQPLLEQGGHHV